MTQAPCRHVRDEPPLCMIGRWAPRDCFGCAAYDACPDGDARPDGDATAPSWLNCDGCPSLLLDDATAECARRTVRGGVGCLRAARI